MSQIFYRKFAAMTRLVMGCSVLKKSTIVEIASFLLTNLFLLYKNILISQILKYFSIYKRYVYPPRLFAVKKQENCPKRYSGHDRNMIIKVNIQLCMDIQQHHLIIIFIWIYNIFVQVSSALFLYVFDSKKIWITYLHFLFRMNSI